MAEVDSKIAEVAARLRPAVCWGCRGLGTARGMLLSILKQRLLLPDHPWPSWGYWGTPRLVGEGHGALAEPALEPLRGTLES